jgi:hypothetical protein
MPKDDADPKRTMAKHWYNLFSPWGEVEDLRVVQKGGKNGNSVYVRFTHRYYAEFAREALTDQINVFQG